MNTAATATKPVSPMPSKPATVTTGADRAATARKGRKPVPENETPEQTFKRLTEPRTTKALNAIRQLKNLSRFKPSDAHREKVFGAIKQALALAEISWKQTDSAAKDQGFTL